MSWTLLTSSKSFTLVFEGLLLLLLLPLLRLLLLTPGSFLAGCIDAFVAGEYDDAIGLDVVVGLEFPRRLLLFPLMTPLPLKFDFIEDAEEEVDAEDAEDAAEDGGGVIFELLLLRWALLGSFCFTVPNKPCCVDCDGDEEGADVAGVDAEERMEAAVEVKEEPFVVFEESDCKPEADDVVEPEKLDAFGGFIEDKDDFTVSEEEGELPPTEAAGLFRFKAREGELPERLGDFLMTGDGGCFGPGFDEISILFRLAFSRSGKDRTLPLLLPLVGLDSRLKSRSVESCCRCVGNLPLRGLLLVVPISSSEEF
jgi:hypothetical protein